MTSTFWTNVPTGRIEDAALNATATVLTEGTIITVSPARYHAMRSAGLLALIDDGVGGSCYGIEREADDMITCVIADTSAFEE
jgi:hypothetical protein